MVPCEQNAQLLVSLPLLVKCSKLLVSLSLWAIYLESWLVYPFKLHAWNQIRFSLENVPIKPFDMFSIHILKLCLCLNYFYLLLFYIFWCLHLLVFISARFLHIIYFLTSLLFNLTILFYSLWLGYRDFYSLSCWAHPIYFLF